MIGIAHVFTGLPQVFKLHSSGAWPNFQMMAPLSSYFMCSQSHEYIDSVELFWEPSHYICESAGFKSILLEVNVPYSYIKSVKQYLLILVYTP